MSETTKLPPPTAERAARDDGTAIIRESIDLLLQEAFDGPPDHRHTWFVSNAPGSSLLGTARHLTAAQAWSRPPGVVHSVAEHVNHLIVSMDVAMKCAHGEEPKIDWERSWECGPPDEGRWHTMQRMLREHHLRMRMWVHADERFERKEALAGFIASIAHAAYHLGAIRQLAAMVAGDGRAADAPKSATARPALQGR